MHSNTAVDELIKISGITDFNNLTPSDADKLLKLVGSQRLKEGHIRALIEIAPSFIELATTGLKTLAALAQAAGSAQSEAAANVRTSIDSIAVALRILAEQARTDETREKIADYVLKAGVLYVELAKISQQMNEDNNGLYKAFAGYLTVAVAVLGAVAATYILANQEGDDQTA